MGLKGVLFDFDGTLTAPGGLCFAEIRSAIGCPKNSPILEFISSLTSSQTREAAYEVLENFEIDAARRAQPNLGAEELVPLLRSMGLRLGIITRNSARAVRISLQNFRHVRESDFEVIVSRDHDLMPKPDPETVFEAARQMSLDPSQCLMVGDFVFDIEAGRKAGAWTVFLTNGGDSSSSPNTQDYTIGRLDDLREVLELFSALPMGKLPNRFLGRLLAGLDKPGDSLIIPPGVGQDIAAARIDGEEVLVLKSDPITFTADSAGTYAVAVNVNDIATSGAAPRWLMVTLLFPPGSCVAEIERVMRDLKRTSETHGLILCGGHTEITDAVTRPVVVGHVAGTVPRRALVEKSNMRRGDSLLITKGIAIEGTSILARELPERLAGLGVGKEEIARCRDLLTTAGVSIVREACIASASGRITAMHDVTEGGLATAVEELSTAGRHRIRVFRQRIPVLDETARLCRLLDLDPLGLIGSGSLLITCDASASQGVVKSIADAGIPATVIGEVLESGDGIEAVNEKGEPIEWPRFAVDEIARVLAGRAKAEIPPVAASQNTSQA